MDKVFRQKLENHEEKPSALAWERLENQLPSHSRKNRGFVWAAAAAILILLSVGALFWSNDSTVKQEDLLASEEPNARLERPSDNLNQLETPKSEKNPSLVDSESKPSPQKADEAKTSTAENPAQKAINTPASADLIAEAAESKETESAEATAIVRNESEPIAIEKTLPELQPIQTHQTVATLTPDSTDEPAYTLTIKSDGLKEEKGLVANLEKTVDQIEGLTEKVDLFANLQDAKNGLYAKLTSKKERVSQKP